MKSSPPSVSVVVPLYNKEPYIRRTLESVLAQSHSDYEVIVVDDGSDDGGAEIAGSLADPRIRIVSCPESRGECAARNSGLEEARASWVAFLDADDEWLPDFLRRLVALFDSNELVAAFSNFRGAPGGHSYLKKVPPGPGIVEDYFSLVRDNDGFGMFSSATIAHRDAFLRCGAFDASLIWGGDTEAWARLAWSGRVAMVPEALVVYHTDIVGSVTSRFARQPPSYPPVLRTYQSWRSAGRIPKRLEESSARYAQYMLMRHLVSLRRSGQQSRAIDLFRREWPTRTAGWADTAAALAACWAPRALLLWLGRARRAARAWVGPGSPSA